MKYFFLLLFFACQGINYSQNTFKKQFGTTLNDNAYTVQQTYDSGYIIMGNVNANGMDKIWLIKTNQYGDSLWSRLFSFGIEQGSDHTLVHCPDSGFAMIGNRNSNVYLLKTTKDGDSLWGKELGHGIPRALEIIDNNSFIITGVDTGGILFVKTNDVGEISVRKNIRISSPGSLNATTGYSIKPIQDGGFIIAGTLSFGDVTAILVKTNSMGDTIWKKYYSYLFNSALYSLTNYYDSSYVMVGNHNYISFNALIMRINYQGDTIWINRMDTPLIQFFTSVISIQDGNLIACGGTNDGNGNKQIFLVKFNSEGSIIWSKSILKAKDIYGTSMCQTYDNELIICGDIQDQDSSHYDIILIKTDASGNVTWTERIYNAPMFSVYPNPADKYITIESHKNITDARIEIFDLTGKCRLKTKLQSSQNIETINIDSLEPGEYLINISDDKNLHWTKKIIKI